MVDLDALIEKQRAEQQKTKTAEVGVALGGEIVTVVVKRLLPDDWQQLTLRFPKPGAAYDKTKLPPEYPASHITLGGGDVTAEKWRAVWAVLEVPAREVVDAIMWGLNYYDAYKELEALGKAEAARRSNLPANRASRRAASKGGSRQKSPGTTPPKGN